MPTQIIRTKISTPPIRHNLVSKENVSKALSEGIADGRRLVLISASAGFGKTTLVSNWLTSCNLPAAWISLEENDSDPTRFLTYLVAALQTIIANIGEEILGMIQSSGAILADSLLPSLLNELSATEDEFVLVLDDYHVIDSKAVHDLLYFLVEHLPPQMHLVIATREDPPVPLARLRARNQLTEIRAADLRFTETEAADFLNRVMGLHLSAEQIVALENRTEGWVAGLQLAALSMQGEQDNTEFIRSFSGTHQFVLDYLLEEVLNKQPGSLQEFLLRTSILDRLSGPLCDAVYPDEKTPGQETLQHLEHANLFVIPLDNERHWYRIHHLFRDLLRHRLGQKLTGEEIAQVHLRASEWFEQNGDSAEAFHHAMTAADFERAARLAESAWLSMDQNFQTAGWLGWVNQLPVSVRRMRPVLCTQLGWAHMDMGDFEASESSLREAEECLKHPRQEMVVVETEQFRTLPARIAIARAYNAQVQNRFADTVKYAEMALDLIPNNDQFMQAQASAILSGTYWARGELDQAYAFMSDWVDAAQQAANYVFAVAASFGKADILITQGRLREALQVYQVALELASTHSAEKFTAHHHLGLGLLYHEMGKDEQAAHHLQKGFDLGRQSTMVDWTYRKNLAQAQLKESEGDLKSTLDFLDEAQRYYVHTPIPNLRPVEAMKARVYVKQGYLLKAQEWARKSGLSLHKTPDHLHEFEGLILARIALAEYQNNHEERLLLDVLGYLEPALKLAEAQNRLRSQVDILITQALTFHIKGNTPSAITSLERALMLAESEGYFRIFLNEGRPITDLISKLENGRLTPYTEKILAASNQINTTQPTSISAQPLIEPLSERELEVLRLIAQGLSNNEICEKLFVALSTVKGHNLRIFNKLQAKSRTEAVARAREYGLL